MRGGRRPYGEVVLAPPQRDGPASPASRLHQVEPGRGGVGHHQGAAGDLDVVRVAAESDRGGPPPASVDQHDPALAGQGHNRPATRKGGQVVGPARHGDGQGDSAPFQIDPAHRATVLGRDPGHGRPPGGGRRRRGRDRRGGGGIGRRRRRAAGHAGRRVPAARAATQGSQPQSKDDHALPHEPDRKPSGGPGTPTSGPPAEVSGAPGGGRRSAAQGRCGGEVGAGGRRAAVPAGYPPGPGRAGGAGSAAGRRRPLSAKALTATMRLDPDIDRAAISGRSTSPNDGSNTPAAIGSAIAL